MAFDLVGRIKIKDDGASKTLRNVAGSLDIVKRKLSTYRDTQGRLRDENGKFLKDTTLSGKAIKGLTKSFDQMGKSGTNAFKSIASKAGTMAKWGAIGLAGGAAYAGVSSLKKAMSFESEMSTIQALTGASTAEMAKMQTLSLKMGAATKYSALEAAQGIEELLKAGITPAAVQAGGLQAALNLAIAGGLDLASAAEVMSTALNAYKKDGMSAAEASNILAGTANASATDVESLRLSLAAVSAVAAGVGLSFKDTNIALGLFANNGLKGSDAGTSLKTMLQNLQPVTKTQMALFKALGLVTKSGSNQFYDAKGNIKSLDAISGSLHKSLGKLTNQQRALALEMMFGTDAVRAANILYNEGADGVKKFEKQMSKVTALDVARKKMDNAAGAVEQFKGALETLQISALMPTLPMLKKLANAAADFVEKYTPRITAAVQKAVSTAKTYLKTHFLDNPEFKKLPDLKSKIRFVFEDIMASFNTWLDNGGRAKITSVATGIIDTLAGALNASQPLIDAAVSIGSAVGKGMLDGLMKFASDHPQVAAIMAGMATPGPIQVKAGAAAVAMLSGPAKQELDNLKSDKPVWKKVLDTFITGTPLVNGDVVGHSHAAGLDTVPYNRYPAMLHKDEAVLTKTEASDYRDGKRGGSGHSVLITGNHFHVRNDGDIDAIARKLALHLAQ